MQGIILVNAYIRSEGALRQAERMKEELSARGLDARVEKNGRFLCRVENNRVALAEKLDFCVYLDKDKYLSRMLEKCGVRLFDSAEAIELCDDKMLTYIALAGGGVNLPDTLPAPLCYYADAKVRQEYVKEIGAALGTGEHFVQIMKSDHVVSLPGDGVGEILQFPMGVEPECNLLMMRKRAAEEPYRLIRPFLERQFAAAVHDHPAARARRNPFHQAGKIQCRPRFDVKASGSQRPEIRPRFNRYRTGIRRLGSRRHCERLHFDHRTRFAEKSQNGKRDLLPFLQRTRQLNRRSELRRFGRKLKRRL